MKRLEITMDGPVMVLDYTGEQAASKPAPRVQGSKRYTSSSRHPGRSIEGTPTKFADAGLPEDLGLCACGMRAESHPEISRHEFTPRSNHNG